MRLRPVLPLLAAAAAAWYVRGVYRFRDPVRLPSAAPGEVLSAADGVVSAVRRVQGGVIHGGTPLDAAALLGTPGAADGWLIAVLVGALDVHYAYQPASGPVTSTTHVGTRANVPLVGSVERLAALTGRPVEALVSRGALENERQAAVIGTPLGDVTLTLVAPQAGLRGLSFLREGDQARAGYKAAFLEEGGLVLLHLPGTFTPAVSVGDRVTGAQTVVARAAP
ncbi:phosphatidylserine decarboxylase [Deinococcus taeanensis]|uniref:phosphatidylserine decarboxylase n=1 Tax=Deinococcus taeanensis TaxID=2737050 RepID=UPI001CDCA746|nr:phosphatidylserine decarboxylase [Deinococcus taeanensis]UBV43040.1 phosphatidylserine decarboxylase [Deinococcus taeanensis]